MKTIKSVKNQYYEALKLIDWEWDLKAEKYIRKKGFVEQTLKLIAVIANC